MSCIDSETATAYLRGDLDPAEAEPWAAHIAECPTCAETVRQTSALMDRVRELLLRGDEASLETDPPPVKLVMARAARARGRRAGGGSHEDANAPRGLLAWSRGDVPRQRRPLRAVLVAGLTALAAVALWTSWPPSRTVSAAELLRDTTGAEARLASAPDQAVHRTLDFEERRLPARGLLARRRIEVWQSGANRLKVRRAFDEAGTPIAGEWIGHDGTRTVYRRGQRPETAAVVAPAAVLRGDELWRLELGARDFAGLIRQPADATVEDRGDRYVLQYRIRSAEGQSGLLSATLVVAKPELRSIGQTLVVRRGDETREYSLVEAGFARLPAARVVPAVFQPEPELRGPPPVTLPPAKVPAPRPRAAVDLDRLEVDAAYRLHRLGVWLGERGQLTRTPAGALRVRAVVPDENRKALVRDALESLDRTRGLEIEVTDATAVSPEATPPRTLVSAIPVHDALLRYFRERVSRSSAPGLIPSPAALDQAVREFAGWVVDRSARRLERARALEALLAQWPEERLRALDLDAVVVWQVMVQDHALAIQSDSEVLRLQLEPAFSSRIDTGSRARRTEMPERPWSIVDAVEKARRLAGRVESEDRAARSAFGPCPGESCPVPDIAELLASLAETEALADGFAQSWVLERSNDPKRTEKKR